MSTCQVVDIAELDRPTVTVSVDIPVSPGHLFEILEDPDAWPRWLTAIDKVTWTSPDPKGIGTTRTIAIGNKFVADEVFIAWEADRRMAFYFTECSRPVFNSFAEDYRVAPTADGCRLTWSVIARPKGVPPWFLKCAGLLLKLNLRSYLTKLRRYAVDRAVRP